MSVVCAEPPDWDPDCVAALEDSCTPLCADSAARVAMETTPHARMTRTSRRAPPVRMRRCQSFAGVRRARVEVPSRRGGPVPDDAEDLREDPVRAAREELPRAEEFGSCLVAMV